MPTGEILLPAVPGLVAAFRDEQEIRDAWWHPGPGDVVLDIGAGVGSYTIPALMAGAAVTAVDPDAAATAKLAHVAAVNSCIAALEIRNCGVWDASAYPDDMYAALTGSQYHYLIPAPGTPFVSLDDVAAGRDVDWVKIDVEGAELGVLRSGVATLRRFMPRLIVELHDEVYPYVADMGSGRQCRELLTSLGYTVQEIPYGPPHRTYLVTE